MDAKKRSNRVVSTDIHEEIDPQTQDTVVVETITTTTTTTTTTKKRIYVRDSNIDLTNIDSLLNDKTDTHALLAIANTASNHSCQLTSGSNKKRRENDTHFEKSANASHSPLSSTKVSNEIRSDEENDLLITVDKKDKHPAPKRSVNSTKSFNHRVVSPNLSCIPCDKNKDSKKRKAKKLNDLKKKTKKLSSTNMPKTPNKYKEKRIEDLISQYISVGPVEHKAKGQNHSNNIANANTDNHNDLSDIAEASFEENDSAHDFIDACGSELAENDDLSSIVPNASPMKLDNAEIESNMEKAEAHTETNLKQTPETKYQRGKRGKFTKKSKSQSESKEDDMLNSDKTDEQGKSAVNSGRKLRKIAEEEKEPETKAPKRKNTKKRMNENELRTEQLEPIETEPTEEVKGNKRPRYRPAAEKTHKALKAKNKGSRAENTKPAQQTKLATVDEPISGATEEHFESNKRSSKRTRKPNSQITLRRDSLEKRSVRYKENKKAKASTSKKIPKTNADTNTNPIDVQVEELMDTPINDVPIMPINKNLFDHKIEIYSPSSRKNFKTDGDSNVIIPEALIKSKLMKLSNAPDEWMNQFNGKKEYKMNSSHRLRLIVPDTMENNALTADAKSGGGDILSRIGKLRKPILIRETGTPTKN